MFLIGHSPVFVHVFVVALAVAAGDAVHPVLVAKVPEDSLFYAYFEQ